MKKTINILIIFMAAFFVSCSLNTAPEDFIAPKYYYNTETECNMALTGVYDMLKHQFATNTSTYFDTADEMYISVSNGIGTSSNNFYTSDVTVSLLWQQLYQGIERASMLLANIDRADMDSAKRVVIKGEAKFLRAFYYFNLVQYFGDIPFKTTPTVSASDIYYARTPASEVYDFVYKEMVEAEGLVRPITDYTYSERVSKSAVQGVLARVCLNMAGFPNNKTEKYEAARVWSEKLIDSKLHSLNPDYAQVFINMIQDKYDLKESIWEIGFRTTGTTDTYGEYGEVGNVNGIGQNIMEYGVSTGNCIVQDRLWRKYAAGDKRRDWAIAPYKYTANSNPPIKEYFDTTKIYYSRNIGKYRREYELSASKQKRANGTNYQLLRYSDVLLMAAEAENEVNGPTEKAHQYLNEVRERAHATIFENISSKEAFRTIIQEERSLELCFEGLRRHDLKRWGILIPAMKELADYVRQTAPDGGINQTIVGRACLASDNITEKNYYFPIPLREMNLNKLLTQNSGW